MPSTHRSEENWKVPVVLGMPSGRGTLSPMRPAVRGRAGASTPPAALSTAPAEVTPATPVESASVKLASANAPNTSASSVTSRFTP